MKGCDGFEGGNLDQENSKKDNWKGGDERERKRKR